MNRYSGLKLHLVEPETKIYSPRGVELTVTETTAAVCGDTIYVTQTHYDSLMKHTEANTARFTFI